MESIININQNRLNENPQFSTFEELISFLNSENFGKNQNQDHFKIIVNDQQIDQLFTYLFREYYPDFEINIADKTIKKADPVLKEGPPLYNNLNRNGKIRLTKREAQVMNMISTGWTRGEIARAFGISKNTLDNHMKNIYAKFGTRNVTQAVRMFRGLPVSSLKSKSLDKVLLMIMSILSFSDNNITSLFAAIN
jgi:DNA-binding CsgD family transcriptional regulator